MTCRHWVLAIKRLLHFWQRLTVNSWSESFMTDVRKPQKAVGFLEANDVSRLLNILGMCKFHAANIWRLTSDNARCTRLFNIWTMPCTAREVQTPVQDTSTFDMATRGCDKSTVGIKRQGLFCHTAQYQALAGQCERTYHEVSTSSEPQQCCHAIDTPSLNAGDHVTWSLRITRWWHWAQLNHSECDKASILTTRALMSWRAHLVLKVAWSPILLNHNLVGATRWARKYRCVEKATCSQLTHGQQTSCVRHLQFDLIAGNESRQQRLLKPPTQTLTISAKRMRRRELLWAWKAAVREYERVRAELARLSVQTQSLRTRSNQVRQLIESFMRERDLKRIATKSGDIVIKFVERSNRVRPSRRDTEKCILEALGPEHSDVAGRLINDLFEAKKEKRQVTKVITPTWCDRCQAATPQLDVGGGPCNRSDQGAVGGNHDRQFDMSKAVASWILVATAHVWSEMTVYGSTFRLTVGGNGDGGNNAGNGAVSDDHCRLPHLPCHARCNAVQDAMWLAMTRRRCACGPLTLPTSIVLPCARWRASLPRRYAWHAWHAVRGVDDCAILTHSRLALICQGGQHCANLNCYHALSVLIWTLIATRARPKAKSAMQRVTTGTSCQETRDSVAMAALTRATSPCHAIACGVVLMIWCAHQASERRRWQRFWRGMTRRSLHAWYAYPLQAGTRSTWILRINGGNRSGLHGVQLDHAVAAPVSAG